MDFADRTVSFEFSSHCLDKDDSTTALPTAYGSIPLPHLVSLDFSASHDTKGSSKSFPKHETRHVAKHKVSKLKQMMLPEGSDGLVRPLLQMFLTIYRCPRQVRARRKLNKDRFISKMFLRGDSVTIVLRNPKQKSEARSISTFVQLLQSQINNSNGSSLVDMGPIKSYAVGRDKRKQLLLMSCQHAADRLEVWAQPVNTLSSVCKAAEIERFNDILQISECISNAAHDTKGSSKSFPKHETRHVAEHKVVQHDSFLQLLLFGRMLQSIAKVTWKFSHHLAVACTFFIVVSWQPTKNILEPQLLEKGRISQINNSNGSSLVDMKDQCHPVWGPIESYAGSRDKRKQLLLIGSYF
ncbi:hypothetical protein Tco_0357064 [Tanacetum coccineum]